MFYAFAAFILIYFIGVGIYQIALLLKKWRERK